ncbi:MAG: hypothetical protein HKO59_16165 [Phycisphaerales bacterium]|nr:cytochrome c3 family protein [Phycisphaerae bacterium]NNF42921.1 hypothetical protein [Phycisphaerales bacterium]NNM27487.1 hypothetical protein [Phycisphaerales bacterium]
MSSFPSARNGRRRALGVGVILACVAGLWFGCSVDRHYEVLSFFFDGVPDPDAPATADGPRDRRRTRTVVSTHVPFRERNCRACHVTATDFGLTFSGYGDVDDSVCLDCHRATVTAFPSMHGPVAGAQCLQCHEAHESAYPALLLTPSPGLCLDCHSPDTGLLDDTLDVHADLTVDCLSCHHGHGGPTPALLRSPAAEMPTESR